MRLLVPRWLRLTLVSSIGLATATLAAQSGTQATDPLIKDFRWRNIGNANLVGRISSVDALERDWTHVIVGSASGGVSKSTNGGITWTPIFDRYGAASMNADGTPKTSPSARRPASG